MWNVIAPIESWEKALAGLDPDFRPKPDEEDTGNGPFPAEETETATFPWAWHSTPDAWCSYLRTKSVFVLMAEREREERLQRAHALMTAACQAGGSATAAVHHEVFCARWRPAV